MSDTSWPNNKRGVLDIFTMGGSYDDYSISYDAEDNVDLVIYYLDGVEVRRIEIVYTISGNPIWMGQELKNHTFNIFKGVFELITNIPTPSPPILDIFLDNDTVYEGSTVSTKVGTLSISGGTAPATYVITTQDETDLFIVLGDEVHVNGSLFGFSGSYNITIRAVDAASEELTEPMVITITPYASTLSTSFDGLTEYCEVPTNAAWQTDDRSMSFWFKGDTPLATTTIISKNRSGSGGTLQEWEIQVFTNGKIAVSVYESSAAYKQYQYSSTLNLTDGNWHHLVWTYEKLGDTFTLYADGVAATHIPGRDDPMPGGIQLGPQPIVIGAGFNSIGTYLRFSDMIFDELGIWNAALNAAEVLDMYNSGSPKSLLQQTYTPSLVSWWRMGDLDTAPVITDVMGVDDLDMINMDGTNFVGDTP